MLIRCQKCQALYSLQDGVAAASVAFRVECGRCLAVFEAPVARRKPLAKTPVEGVRPAPLPPPRPAAPRQFDRKPPARPQQRPGSRPRPGSPGSDDDEFERQLQSAGRTRRKLLIAGAAVALLAVLAGGFFALRPRLFGGLPAEAVAKLGQAREKLLLDDAKSLEEAAALLTEAARLAPGEAAPEAERAFVLLLEADSHKDVADRLEATARELRDQAARLEVEKREGFEAQVARISDEARKLVQEREPHVRDSNRLLQQGVAAAKAALDEDPQDAAALRAMALYCALSDASERGARYLQAAAKKAPQEALVAYTQAALALSGAPSPEKQDRALSSLAVARQAEPKLLRATYDAARIAFDRREPGPARTALARIVQQNPAHERALRLLALLPAQ